MKKRLLTIAAIGVAVCCLGACKPASSGTAADEYDDLNAMLNADYSQIVLTVTNTYDEDTSLKSEYTITYSETQITVEYSVERFVDISLDNPSKEIKTTLSGVAVIINDDISFNGDEVDITAEIAKPGLTFKKDYFKNAQLTGNYLIADVKNASAFLGSQLNCSDMKVNAIFLDMFYEIQISYISESGNKVEIEYLFNI